ncbi:DNA ligase [Pseudoalteromonas rubra]|uniref:DNA ligase n=1 Tax=Pseudoalteromonas rubra TaxID=43658 RepID=A0A5S3WK81_9GAMM|nr:DNA ligase [Pseudoalteromonas rubra]TMP27257.1 DNA ligase [Pseudoalteromonas rubra]TMP36795.1 DNA ligase [Pseudoalteromonas rubra]
MHTKLFGLLLLACLCQLQPAYCNPTPAVQLAKVYQAQRPVMHYLVSEKFDGVRAIWNGRQLLTRSGQQIHAPHWFTSALPDMALDGELWAGYENFEFVSAVVRRHQTSDQDWRQVQYLIFDAPDLASPFTQRFQAYSQLINRLAQPHIRAVPQHHFSTKAELDDFFAQVLSRGGEGVMLHERQALHQQGRTSAILKYKPYFDAEAEVIAHLPGKGKYQGMMGAIRVKTPEGKVFKIGSGFTDEQRRNPPPIGSVVTYRFQGVTKFGKPRFARFLRTRQPL